MGALDDKRLWIVSGKGGVGKSSVAAALALSSASSGKRTLVCEINADERVSALLGHPPVGPEIGLLEPNLWAVDTRPPEAMREYALMILKFKTVYRAVFENRLVRYFLRFIPSLSELVMLGKVLFHLQEKRADGSWRFERIVMDAPATGHALSFLSVPQVLLDTVAAGPMADEARKMRDLLVDPKVTAAVLVALPEEMPVNETLELSSELKRRVHLSAQAAVLNGFIAQRFTDSELAELSGSPAHALAHAQAERARTSALALSKLERGLQLPVQTVPRLFSADFGREAIVEIARALRPLAEGAP